MIIDIWALRKATRTSYKEYLKNAEWLKKRDYLDYRESESAFDGAFQYLWSLWTKQKGKDAITKENLNPFEAEIHHIKPVVKGGSNELENLILISRETHKLLHNRENLDKRFEKYQKHLK